MKKTWSLSIGVGVIAIMLLSFQNCSKTNFKSTGVDVNPQTSTSTSTDQEAPPVTTEVPVTSLQDLPKYKVFIESCKAGDICKVSVVLDKVMTADYSFDWKTNDTIYQTNPSKYARPNFHYIPTYGHSLISAGQSKAILEIKSINWSFNGTTDSTVIALDFSNCKYDSQLYSCSSLQSK